VTSFSIGKEARPSYGYRSSILLGGSSSFKPQDDCPKGEAMGYTIWRNLLSDECWLESVSQKVKSGQENWFRTKKAAQKWAEEHNIVLNPVIEDSEQLKMNGRL
jgi:hypothetical protein